MLLHGYFRSSAAWRVRIALALKSVRPETRIHNLRTGEHLDEAYRAVNPQALVPALELDDGTVLTQSLAIIGWLDRSYPEPPLLPENTVLRAQVEAFALAIACDIHPLQNLKVLKRLRAAGWSEDEVAGWIRTAIADGFAACEALLPDSAAPFCFGAAPGLADLCLVPQIGSARRFGLDLTPFPRLVAIDAACAGLPAFISARPDRQPDAI
ncbi:maleylacetoacetate isomerase [Bosea sp. (in: a-proteobacteria)]|uniref:maleylacetoacetate isomerase n=1 Tax=Bosea sp. (in: a-proteobacteria) TaxID=1871050 RepID=UPI003F6F41FA